MNKFLKIFILCVFLFSQAVSGQGQSIAGQTTSAQRNVIQIRKAFWDSLPAPKAWTSDYEGLFNPEEEAVLNQRINEFERKTTIQFAVVTVDTTLVEKSHFDALAAHILNTWGVGHKETNNGVVILVCSGYRRIRISTGYGVEKVLSDEEVKKVIDSYFVPSFREGEYFDGTLRGLETLMGKLENQPSLRSSR